MKVGQKYIHLFPDGQIASKRIITNLTDVSVFSQNLENPQQSDSRESISKFNERVKKGYYKFN